MIQLFRQNSLGMNSVADVASRFPGHLLPLPPIRRPSHSSLTGRSPSPSSAASASDNASIRRRRTTSESEFVHSDSVQPEVDDDNQIGNSGELDLRVRKSAGETADGNDQLRRHDHPMKMFAGGLSPFPVSYPLMSPASGAMPPPWMWAAALYNKVSSWTWTLIQPADQWCRLRGLGNHP